LLLYPEIPVWENTKPDITDRVTLKFILFQGQRKWSLFSRTEGQSKVRICINDL